MPRYKKGALVKSNLISKFKSFMDVFIVLFHTIIIHFFLNFTQRNISLIEIRYDFMESIFFYNLLPSATNEIIAIIGSIQF